MEDVYLSTHMIALQQNQNKEIRNYFDEVLPRVTLSTLKNAYFDVSQNIRCDLLCCVSSELKLLNCIALWLPEEIQKYIYSKMLNGDVKEEGMNIFYNKQSMLESFEMYQTIIKKIGIDKPISPLYTLNKKEELSDVLEKIKHLHSSYFGVVMSQEEHREIQAMRKEIQQYFVEHDASVLSNVDMREYKTAVDLGISGFVLMLILSGVSPFSGILGIVSCGMSGFVWLAGSWQVYKLQNMNKCKIIGS
jgi:hypothetical protein